MSRDTDPDLNDIFAVAFEREQAAIRTIIPAHVTAFSRNPRECSVKIDLLAQLRSGDTVQIPEINRCPVVWPVGGGFAMDADLAIGEQVLVLVCDRDISGWLPTGAVEAPSRRLLHDVTNAIVLPGLRSINRQGRQSPATGELYLGSDTGNAPWLTLGTVPPSATIEAPAISLGDGATLGVARLTDTVAANTAGVTLLTNIQLALAAIVAVPPINANAAAVNAVGAVTSALAAGLTGLGIITGASAIVRSK